MTPEREAQMREMFQKKASGCTTQWMAAKPSRQASACPHEKARHEAGQGGRKATGGDNCYRFLIASAIGPLIFSTLLPTT